MEKEFEIRKLLGNEYHLSISYNEGLENPRWVLFRKYTDTKVYFSEDNEPIMSSEKNSINELYQYAKKHHKIDEHSFILKLNIIVAWVVLILMIINFLFFKNEIFRGLLLGIDLTIIFYSIVSHIIWEKNWKVSKEEWKENIKNLRKMRK